MVKKKKQKTNSSPSDTKKQLLLACDCIVVLFLFPVCRYRPIPTLPTSSCTTISSQLRWLYTSQQRRTDDFYKPYRQAVLKLQSNHAHSLERVHHGPRVQRSYDSVLVAKSYMIVIITRSAKQYIFYLTDSFCEVTSFRYNFSRFFLVSVDRSRTRIRRNRPCRGFANELSAYCLITESSLKVNEKSTLIKLYCTSRFECICTTSRRLTIQYIYANH